METATQLRGLFYAAAPSGRARLFLGTKALHFVPQLCLCVSVSLYVGDLLQAEGGMHKTNCHTPFAWIEGRLQPVRLVSFAGLRLPLPRLTRKVILYATTAAKHVRINKQPSAGDLAQNCHQRKQNAVDADLFQTLPHQHHRPTT